MDLELYYEWIGNDIGNIFVLRNAMNDSLSHALPEGDKMCPPRQSDSNYEEIAQNKRINREQLIRFIKEGPSDIVAADAERLREAMRKKPGEGKRRRIEAPAFSEPNK